MVKKELLDKIGSFTEFRSSIANELCKNFSGNKKTKCKKAVSNSIDKGIGKGLESGIKKYITNEMNPKNEDSGSEKDISKTGLFKQPSAETEDFFKNVKPREPIAYEELTE